MSSIRRRLFVATLVAVAVTLGACETPAPPRPVYPPISFKDQAPIHLTVGEVAVETRYLAPGNPPNVDHLFPARILEAAQSWPKDRLVASSAGFRAEFVILDASVVAVPLKGASGLKALVTKDQSERYDARVAVEMRIVDSAGRVVATAQAEAKRSRSVREDITLHERERVWYEMAKDIMAELDRQLDQTIKSALSPYIL